MRCVTLVPWRGGDELREQNWELTRPYLERLGYPLVTGDSEGAWSRAAALNAAALAAGRWDMALIADADTIPDAAAVKAAVRLAARTRGGVRPHQHLLRLTPSGSIAFAMGKPLEDRHVQEEFLGGGLLVVAREGWDRVGGFDERFVGWGAEDSAFGISLLVKAAWDRVPGTVSHLFHLSGWVDSPDVRRNRKMLQAMKREHRKVIADASAAKGYDVGAVL